MAENFECLLLENKSSLEVNEGSLIKAVVTGFEKDFVIVDSGLKSESYIPIKEFTNVDGELTCEAGDEVEVYLEYLADGRGSTVLSYEKALVEKTWVRLVSCLETGELVKAKVLYKVRSGLMVEVDGVKGFLPGSLVDVKPVKDFDEYEGQVLELKVVKIDKQRNNIVVSRKAVLEKQNSQEREAILSTMHEGQIIPGIVKNITDYGAFIDLGGIDGLLHITDIAWKRVSHPSDVLAIGDKIEVKVLSFDNENFRVSLGMKQMSKDPWLNVSEDYPVGTVVQGKTTNITDYGVFVEIIPGIEGLVHTSELDWANKNPHPHKVVHLGQEVQIKILEIEHARRRIAMSIKQVKDNPWVEFSNTHTKGDVVKGPVQSITDFGLFVGLSGNLDGLVHLSDISWEISGAEALKQYKKGQEVETVILAIDASKERISLGIKQLTKDNFSEYLASHPKGSIVKGKVIAKDDTVSVELASGITGQIKLNNLVEDVNLEQDIEAKIIGIDSRARIINLSVKAKEIQEEINTVRNYKNTFETSATLGDLMKNKIDEE